MVRDAWAATVRGTMFRLVTKLKRVKKALIKWNRRKQSTSSRVQNARLKLEVLQTRVPADNSSTRDLFEEERKAKSHLHEL